jgi:hypothetical protein
VEFLSRGAKDVLGGPAHFGDPRIEKYLNVSCAAFGFEEVCNARGRMVAEELAKRFFVVGDAVLPEENQEIRRSETGERGLCKMWIRREKILWFGVKVGEIATTAAGNQDFFADAVGMLYDGYAAASLAGLKCAKQPGCAGAEDQDVKGTGQKSLSGN